ncbi:hypothetical protein SSX86_015963 [Deinandra increscens subsp. villosa]|uniref:DUF4228 domain-containing protein n=1 Tax=Deinandra increscens subsp. villosa TaxID=3103831 RepID=A0AAP0CYR3_9ASTR
MGNYASSGCNCSPMLSPRTKNHKSARVVFPLGEIRQFPDPVKAAEIMIECPNFFLVNSESLSINRRFSPLSADEELESGNVYVMFPMRRMSSVVTPADMAVFWMAADSAGKRIGAEKSGEDEGRVALLDGVAGAVPEFSQRMMACRSRKPLLDTIGEETVFCR